MCEFCNGLDSAGHEEEETMAPDLYVYRAKLDRIIDGDTIDVDIDLGLGVWKRGQRLRLIGVNTPEVRGPEREQGVDAKRFVVSLFAEHGSDVFVRTVKDKTGKYGRWLADVFWVVDDDHTISLCRILKAKGWAS